MTRKLLLIFLFAGCLGAVRAQNKVIPKVVTPGINPALRFTENAGQWDPRIMFRMRLDGGALFVEKNCLTFNFYDKKKYRALHHGALARKEYTDFDIKGHAYKVIFDGASDPRVEKQDKGTFYENFYIGSDPSKWKSNVQNYQRVWLRDLYPGIDYEAITSAQGIKYNFIVKAGYSLSRLAMRYEGVDDIHLKDGAVIINTDVNSVTEQRPYAYQVIDGQIREVPCRYALKNKTLTFEFPAGYDAAADLVIDPVLVFSAQIGSTADNFGMTATYDNLGNLYSAGVVFDAGYPYITGSYSNVFNSNTYYSNSDLFVTKYNAAGNALIFSTYLGGQYNEIVSSLVVDHNNNLCLYGATGSNNFPVTAGATYTSFGGGSNIGFLNNGSVFFIGTDIFVSKFNSSGSSLLGSTYYGGLGNDGMNYLAHTTSITWPSGGSVNTSGYDSLMMNYGDQYRGEIQVDSLNNIYIASSTRSSSLPIVGGFDNTLGGKQDALILKFNSSLTTLLYSSYIGGSQIECGNALFVTPSLEVYVTGGTTSNNFPGTSGGYSSTYNGGKSDGFLIKINASGSAILQSTYIGTGQYDNSFFVQCDNIGRPYVYGQSLGNMTVVASPSQSVFSVSNTHQFVTRFNSGLTALNMSTVFGSKTNGIDISPSAFAIDECNGNLYLSGWGGGLVTNTGAMSGMPLMNPTQSTTTGYDFYLMALSPNANALLYGSYFGGGTSQEHVDGGTSRFDRTGIIYQSVCAGCGGNQDFPITNGAWPCPGSSTCNIHNYSSNCNNGVFKMNFQLQNAIATIHTNTIAGCAPLTVTLTNASPGTSYIWYMENGDTTSMIPSPVVTFSTVGSHTISLKVIDSTRCVKHDSTAIFFTVYPSPVAAFSVASTPCANQVTLTNSSSGTLAANPYSWNAGNGSPTVSAANPTFTYNTGTYTISLSVKDVNGCIATKTGTVAVLNFSPAVSGSLNLCAGVTGNISASGGTGYTWTPATFLSNSLIASPAVTATASTIYTVKVLNNTFGFNCQQTLTTNVNVLPVPTASFNLQSTQCNNTVSTSNLSSGNLGSSPYAWDFGDGSPLVAIPSPSHTYADGSYTIALTVTDVNGCKSQRTATVSILNFQPAITGSATICDGKTRSLLAYGGTSYSWSPAVTLNNNTISNPVASPHAATVYSVHIVNVSQGFVCETTLTTQVLVNPTPTTAFTYSMNGCGGAVNFFDGSVSDITSWSWTLAPGVNSQARDPYYFYSKGGNFPVTLVTTNIYGCSSQQVQNIAVPPPPQVSISNPVSICKYGKTQLHAGGGIEYQWTPTVSLDYPNLEAPTASPTVSTEYSVKITTSFSVNGMPCEYLLTTSVTVDVLSYAPANAMADPVVVVSGEPTTLTYLGDPGATVTWLPPNTTPATGYTVTAYPTESTTYTAQVSRGACGKQVEVHVDAYTKGCLDEDVFIPNTFTPNGDGKNDVLYVRGLKVDEIYFAVYDRWGELVFETSDKTRGWDGVYKNKPSDVGVFGWYLKAKCFNGLETFKKGNVTLIR